MDVSDLHLFITEDLYLIREKKAAVTTAPTERNDPAVLPGEQKSAPIPLAIFHASDDKEDRALLDKIIQACKLSDGDFQLFDGGFDKEISFEKALVFVAEAQTYYEPVKYQNSQILCARPLSEIATNKEEKSKLWGALQTFLSV